MNWSPLNLTVRVGCNLAYETSVPTPVLFAFKPRLESRVLVITLAKSPMVRLKISVSDPALHEYIVVGGGSKRRQAADIAAALERWRGYKQLRT